MASNELKPCPFCGCSMSVRSNRDWHRIIGDHDEQCVFMEAETMMVPASDEQLAIAVTDWNRRAQDFDAMRQRVELLERLLSTARDYVYSELEERKAAMAGYPHKWQQEEADLAEIDAALAKQP